MGLVERASSRFREENPRALLAESKGPPSLAFLMCLGSPQRAQATVAAPQQLLLSDLLPLSKSGDCRPLFLCLAAGLEFERWLNATGPPLIEPDLSQGSSLTSPVETLFSLWTTEPLDALAAAGSVDITKWRTFQTVLFLDRLLDGSPLPHGEYCGVGRSMLCVAVPA